MSLIVGVSYSSGLDWTTLLEWRDRAKQAGRTVIWTNGCFDILHVGHVRCLKAAREAGDALIVGLNSDASVRRLKGPGRPITPFRERAEILSALACVDFVVGFEGSTPEQVIRRLRPDVHFKGGDYAPPNGKPIPEATIIREYGGRIEFFPVVESRSTSDLIARIRSDGS